MSLVADRVQSATLDALGTRAWPWQAVDLLKPRTRAELAQSAAAPHPHFIQVIDVKRVTRTGHGPGDRRNSKSDHLEARSAHRAWPRPPQKDLARSSKAIVLQPVAHTGRGPGRDGRRPRAKMSASRPKKAQTPKPYMIASFVSWPGPVACSGVLIVIIRRPPLKLVTRWQSRRNLQVATQSLQTHLCFTNHILPGEQHPLLLRRGAVGK